MLPLPVSEIPEDDLEVENQDFGAGDDVSDPVTAEEDAPMQKRRRPEVRLLGCPGVAARVCNVLVCDSGARLQGFYERVCREIPQAPRPALAARALWLESRIQKRFVKTGPNGF